MQIAMLVIVTIQLATTRPMWTVVQRTRQSPGSPCRKT